ncbi:hypothetical protein PHISCL_11262, partial [Aspergillus sclerotialis]
MDPLRRDSEVLEGLLLETHERDGAAQVVARVGQKDLVLDVGEDDAADKIVVDARTVRGLGLL